MKHWLVWLILVGALQACTPGPDPAMGFRLPAGDPASGARAFTDLRCHTCHTVPGIGANYLGTGAATVALGGKTTRVRTYGELVTSIINPSHKLAPAYPPEAVTTNGESVMGLANLNQVMTVQQLIDVVAFLQAKYEVTPPERNPYTYVYP